jgi:hypothetical protein
MVKKIIEIRSIYLSALRSGPEYTNSLEGYSYPNCDILAQFSLYLKTVPLMYFLIRAGAVSYYLQMDYDLAGGANDLEKVGLI